MFCIHQSRSSVTGIVIASFPHVVMLQDKPIMNIQHVVLVEAGGGGGGREGDKHRDGNAAERTQFQCDLHVFFFVVVF